MPSTAASPQIGCADPAAAAALLMPHAPAGPAAGKDNGVAVTSTWSLDSGSITVAPPPAGFSPTVSELQAGCQLAFASRTNGTMTIAQGKLELATVTVDPVRSHAGSGVPAYQHRVSWVLVTAPAYVASSCPTGGPSLAADPTVRADPYELLLVDARTGDDMLAYGERASSSCPQFGPVPSSVGTPMQRRSLAWTLVSRSPDGGTVVVRASWRSCDVFSQPIADNGIVLPPHQVIGPDGAFLGAADHDNPTVISVQVVWPLGACGPEQPHVVTVGPAVAGAPLSADLGHAALGVLPYSQ
ncbi:hypothetical protein acdb102_29370 [Acidothermaceae bacterium B102]|nr:hypothetical protein acdb102_29370 [Acidothermaceae bacterium B102]